MDQLDDSLVAAGVRLTSDVLDAVDDIVPPGTDVVEQDPSADPISLRPRNRRRPQS
jgi:aryl-alcohol dehydrogenase (NADP+)